MHRFPLSVFTILSIVLVSACTAPPYQRTPEERRRPEPEDPRRFSGMAIDERLEATRLKDIVLRGAAKALEDDEWRFFEIKIEGEDEPKTFPFSEIRRVLIRGLRDGKLELQLIPRKGTPVKGLVNRRSAIEGETILGPCRVKLRKLKSLTFDPNKN